MFFRLCCTLIFALSVSAMAAPLPEEPVVVRMTVHPCTAPEPAMKYRLYPELFEQTTGDAAPLYHKAFDTLEIKPDEQELISDLLDKPESEIQVEPAKALLASHQVLLDAVEVASRCDHCDWGFPIRDNSLTAKSLPLSQFRFTTRLLAVKIQLQIRGGNFDDALRTFRTGFGMAYHLRQNATKVQALVTIGLDQILLERVTEFQQSAGSPNLYWALADLPRPIIDLRTMAETERSIARSLPWVGGGDPRKAPAGQFAGLFSSGVDDLGSATDKLQKLAAVNVSAKAYLVSHGYTQQQVNEMPSTQIAGIYFIETYEKLSDEILKLYRLPYWQIQFGDLKDFDRKVIEWSPNPLFAFLPSITSYRIVAQAERHFAMLQTVDGLREYAATHKGLLPAKLADLSFPAPIDPVTGTEFAYHLEGNQATLRGAAPHRQKETEARIFYITLVPN